MVKTSMKNFAGSMLRVLGLITFILSTAACASLGNAKPDVRFYEDFWRTYYRYEIAVLEANYDYRKIDGRAKEELKSFLDRNKEYRNSEAYRTLRMRYSYYKGVFPISFGAPAQPEDWLLVSIEVALENIPSLMSSDGVDIDYEAIREEVLEKIQEEREGSND